MSSDCLDGSDERDCRKFIVFLSLIYSMWSLQLLFLSDFLKCYTFSIFQCWCFNTFICFFFFFFLPLITWCFVMSTIIVKTFVNSSLLQAAFELSDLRFSDKHFLLLTTFNYLAKADSEKNFKNIVTYF